MESLVIIHFKAKLKNKEITIKQFEQKLKELDLVTLF